MALSNDTESSKMLGKRYVKRNKIGKRPQLVTTLLNSANTQNNNLDYEAAIHRRDLSAVVWLIENNVSLASFETNSGETALSLAISLCNLEVIQHLMEPRYAVSINTANKNGYTPLMKAIAGASDDPKSISVISVILEYSPDVLQRDNKGKTAIDWAERKNLPDIVRRLKNLVVEKNELDMSISNQKKRQEECLTILQRNSTIIGELDALLHVPLVTIDVFDSILMQAADIEKVIFDAAARDLSQIEKYNQKVNGVSRVHYLEYETKNGWTLLTKASACGHAKIVQSLLVRGALIDYETKYGHTALSWACCAGFGEVVLILLVKGSCATRQSTFDGQTPLMHAVRNSHVTVVRILLKHIHNMIISPLGKANFAAPEDEDSIATSEWYLEFFKILYTKDKYNRHALDYASTACDPKHSMAKKNSEKLSDLHCCQIKQLLQNEVEKAENHKEYAMANREREFPTACQSVGCNFTAPRDLLAVHEQYECNFRTICCEKCKEKVEFQKLIQHVAHFCPKREVSCTNKKYGCMELISHDNQYTHEQYHCRKRMVKCRLNCQSKALTWDSQTHHEMNKCPLRVVSCPLGCDLMLQAKDVKPHCRMECTKRMIVCDGGGRIGMLGCGLNIQACELAFHRQHLCSQRLIACKFESRGCEIKLAGVTEARFFHEQHECLFRDVQCRNNCLHSGNIMAGFLSDHYTWHCPLESKVCPNNCLPVGDTQGDAMSEEHNKNIYPEHLLRSHVDPESGDCQNRMTRCRLDMCGKFIDLVFYKDHLEDPANSNFLLSDYPNTDILDSRKISLRAYTTRITCFKQKMHDLCTKTLALNEQQICPVQGDYLEKWLQSIVDKMEYDLIHLAEEKMKSTIKCRILAFLTDSQHHLIEFPNGHTKWLSLKYLEFSFVENHDSEQFQCEWVRASDRIYHESYICPMRSADCPLLCGQRLPFYSIDSHVRKRCCMRNYACRLGCGTELRYIDLQNHEEIECRLRTIACEYCCLSIEYSNLTSHSTVCNGVLRSCRLGCSQLVAISDRDSHESEHCPKRLIQCQRCDQTIWVSEQDVHTNDECPLREFGPCELCQRVLLVNEVANHSLYTCPWRKISCDQCGIVVAAFELKEHQKLLCDERDVQCRMGCGQKVKHIDADSHELVSCSKRSVYCGYRCGSIIPNCEKSKHEELLCPMRVIPCPRGCTQIILAYQDARHKSRCPLRLLPCGLGAESCVRPLALWIKNRELRLCAKHGESALIWAMRELDRDLVVYILQNIVASQVNLEHSNGSTPLIFAVCHGMVEMVEVLLKFDAKVNLETSRGRTALSEACISRNVQCVRLLLKHRANAMECNRHGRKLLDMASQLACQEHEIYCNNNTKEKVIKPLTQIECLSFSDGSVESPGPSQQILKLLEDRAALVRDHTTLFRAIACSDYNYVLNLFRHNKPVDQTIFGLGSAAKTFETLQADCEYRKKQHEASVNEEIVAKHAWNECVSDIEQKNKKSRNLVNDKDSIMNQIAYVERMKEASNEDSNALEREIREFIRSINAKDIATLLNGDVPEVRTLVVMKSICMMMGVIPRGDKLDIHAYTDVEWWKTAQALLMDRGLLQRLRKYREREIPSDVMAKIRRECLRSPAFKDAIIVLPRRNKSVEDYQADNGTDHRHAASLLPSADAYSGDIVGLLAGYIQGVDCEHTAKQERASLDEQKQRLANALDETNRRFSQAQFDIRVAQRSLIARKAEADECHDNVQVAKKKLMIARSRIAAHRLLHYRSENGHTPLSFACAIGNEAMVNILLSHGATCGYDVEECSLSATLIQIITRTYLEKKVSKNNQTPATKKSDLEVGHTMDSRLTRFTRQIVNTFLISSIKRALTQHRQATRVPLHEAIMNGFPQVSEILIEWGAHVHRKTHIVPLRLFPCISALYSHENSSTIIEVNRMKVERLSIPASNSSNATELVKSIEDMQIPMDLSCTLQFAIDRYNSRVFRTSSGGWGSGEMYYDRAAEYVKNCIDFSMSQSKQNLDKILAHKSTARKVAAQKKMHQMLETYILGHDFKKIMDMLDQGAFADYETSESEAKGWTALMIACTKESYIKNADGYQVLAVQYLLDRVVNRPHVNSVSSFGETALRISMAYGTLNCAQVLIERGAKVNLVSKYDKKTPLHVAVEKGQKDSLQFLLQQKGIDVFHRDSTGKTAFDCAVDKNLASLIPLLATAMMGVRDKMCVDKNANFGICRWGCGYVDYVNTQSVGDDGIQTTSHPLKDHEELECRKRIVICERQCGIDLLWQQDLSQHLQLECNCRPLVCTNINCGVQIPFKDFKQHVENECNYRLVHCVCGQAMIHQKYLIHKERNCEMRPVHCDLGCDTAKVFTYIDLKVHQRTECAYRVAKCRNGCAFSSLKWKDRELHEEQQCEKRLIPCQLACGEFVAFEDIQSHLSQECLQREVICPQQCGHQIIFHDLMHHIFNDCPRRLAVCTKGCGLRIPLDQLDQHIVKECINRLIECSSCGSIIAKNDIQRHNKYECAMRLTVCGLCGVSDICYQDLQHHRSEVCRMRRVTCRFNCFSKMLLAHERDQHENYECILRAISCPLGCKQVFIAKDLKRHEKFHCIMRFVECRNGCGLECREKDREEHEKLYCSVQKDTQSEMED